MIYLDNAATSFPKPPMVIEEATRCMREYCGNGGRGSHSLALASAEAIFRCRQAAAELFSFPKPENVIFTWNATMALNMAIKGLVRRGNHVLISDMEHNAVFRPVYKLAREGVIKYDIFPTFPLETQGRDEKILAGIERLITPKTKLLICAHASNICSSTLPLEKIGRLCRKKGLWFVVDAAQSAGHLPIDMTRMHIDALCVPGHKGLFGIQGSGMLIFGEDIIAETLMEGGNGVNSLEGRMPSFSPERYESGTLPTPAIVGLYEGIRFVQETGVDCIGTHLRQLNMQLQHRLLSMDGIEVAVPNCVGSVLLFRSNAIPADRLGEMLNDLGFCVRTGFHCSALAHKTLGTPPTGAIRVSPSIFTTAQEMELLADAVQELLHEAHP
jgi:cysteine desulfurase family protein